MQGQAHVPPSLPGHCRCIVLWVSYAAQASTGGLEMHTGAEYYCIGGLEMHTGTECYCIGGLEMHTGTE